MIGYIQLSNVLSLSQYSCAQHGHVRSPIGGGKRNHQGGKASIASANLGKSPPMTVADQEMTGETTVDIVAADTQIGTRY